LISSIKRRCKRTLASRSLSVSNELAAGGGGGSGAGSGMPVNETVSAGPSSNAGTRAGAATWCVPSLIIRFRLLTVVVSDSFILLMTHHHMMYREINA